jgi:hypothetical protein
MIAPWRICVSAVKRFQSPSAAGPDPELWDDAFLSADAHDQRDRSRDDPRRVPPFDGQRTTS